MNNEKIIIGIIDDGINSGLYGSDSLVHNVEITKELIIQPRKAVDSMLPSHGTSCAAIIRKYAPDAPLCSIKIMNNDTGRGVKEQLIKAIEWCTEQGIRLLNISLGSTAYRDFADITGAVNDAARKGVIIVAAGDNRNIITCPASLTNAIGVKCDRLSMVGEGEYIYNYYTASGIDLTACGSYTLTRATGENRILSPSNSFAASFITAKIYNIMKKLPQLTVEEIRKKLAEDASNTDCLLDPHLYKSIDWTEKALVFEMGHDSGDSGLQNSSFEILAWQHIDTESLHEALSIMTDFFVQNHRLAKEADTVVIINNIPGKQYGWDTNEFLYNLNRAGKGVIYIRVQDTEEISPNIQIKPWRTSACYKFYRNALESSYIQMPVILLCDCGSGLLADILYELENAFREDGYHTLAAVDNTLKAISGLGFLLLPEGDAGSGLEALARDYDPDIILVGTDADKGRHEMPKADILIETMRDIESADDKPGEEIYFRLSTMEKTEYKLQKTLYSTKGVPIGEIYSYITYLFKARGDS